MLAVASRQDSGRSNRARPASSNQHRPAGEAVVGEELDTRAVAADKHMGGLLRHGAAEIQHMSTEGKGSDPTAVASKPLGAELDPTAVAMKPVGEELDPRAVATKPVGDKLDPRAVAPIRDARRLKQARENSPDSRTVQRQAKGAAEEHAAHCRDSLPQSMSSGYSSSGEH